EKKRCAVQDVIKETPLVSKVSGKTIASISASKSNQLQTPAELQQTATVASAISSGTPAYQPAPRRLFKPTHALQSPFVNDGKKQQFKCSKEVCQVYNAVIQFATKRTTRSSQSPQKKDQVILDYSNYWVNLRDLSDSVMFGKELISSVAEAAICTLDDPSFQHNGKSKMKRIPKRVMPLRIASYLINNDLNHHEVNRVFRRAENHLDRCHMIFFPVLQTLIPKGLSEGVGHYFLLVLNLRDQQFEVLDSMRTILDKDLKGCCDKMMDSIKALWEIHYPNTRKKIQNYYIEDIKVPRQTNRVDCGFHMLMNVEQWDGRNIPSFDEADMPNIRKLMTYKWITHELNDVRDWKEKLNLT
ncbi:hypothetical protein EJB05_11944, partial [Eragrostis curvula]